MIYNFVIYHKGCLDGFTGFIILTQTKKIHKNAIIYPDMPSSKIIPKNIENKNVIIIDTAYSYDILKEIVKLAKTVTFIDHHVTIEEDVKKIQNENENIDKLTIVYDKIKSGSSLTWKYFYPNEQLPYFVRYIEDNDTGTWKLKYTNEFINGLTVNYDAVLNEYNVKKWKKLFENSEVKYLINKGKQYEEYINHLLEYNSNKYSMMLFPSTMIYEKFTEYFDKPAQYKVGVFCGSGCPSVTRLSRYLLKKIDCDFIIIWTFNLDRKEFVLSFRSETVDVGKIATIFNGGGHKLASACSFSSKTYYIDDLFMEFGIARQNKKT
jgi:oligoribonuclease NrnB/cAMP/cGMP phosphodiesterase (DHH superfamily)